MSCYKNLFLGQGMALLPCHMAKRVIRTLTRTCPTFLIVLFLIVAVAIMRFHCSSDMIARRGTKRWLCE